MANKRRICYAEIAMARRPEVERILTKEELEELRNNLLHLSVPSIEKAYQAAHHDCRYRGNRLPPATAVQQLVCAWRVLRKMLKPK